MNYNDVEEWTEWGDFESKTEKFSKDSPVQAKRVEGKWFYRHPKELGPEVYYTYVFCFDTRQQIKLTRINGTITVELV